MVMGHEFAGVVTEVGSGVSGVREGDAVAVEPHHTCGHCPACLSGRYKTCCSLGFIGLSGGGGGCAEYCVVDAELAHPLHDMATDVGALVEPLAVAVHAVRLSGIRPGGTAVVFGAGPIGLVTAANLRAAGAGLIVVVEPAAARKAKAHWAGADVVLDPTTTDVVAAVADLTAGAGADVAFECAGIDAVLAQAVGSVKAGGRVVNVAIGGHPATGGRRSRREGRRGTVHTSWRAASGSSSTTRRGTSRSSCRPAGRPPASGQARSAVTSMEAFQGPGNVTTPSAALAVSTYEASRSEKATTSTSGSVSTRQ